MQKTSWNESWRFELADPASRMWREPDDATWRSLDLPHDWSIELDRAADAASTASGGYFRNGRGLYHKHFVAPEEWRGKKVFVEFEGVYMNAEVMLNENFLGRHPYGYTTFVHDLTPYLRFGEDNVLRVTVDNAAEMNSRWYSGSGIYRPVWLIVADPLHVAHWGVSITTPQVSAETATVRIETRVWNMTGEKQLVELHSVVQLAGQPLGSATTIRRVAYGESDTFIQEVQVANPRLWSPDSPTLYQLETRVEAGGRVTDSCQTSFGIRTLEVSAEQGFLLNGVPLKLKGGCVHHDNGVLGAVSFPRAEERKVELHKASGYNAIRCAHNPPAPSFLDACDRLGMLVMDEAFDCWRTGKNPYDYHVAFDDWWQRDIASMVLRDRNHPSVVMWSIGNEVLERDGRSGGAEIARSLAEAVRAIDTTRPISSAICGVWDQHRTWEDTDPVFAALDVGGYNYQWAVYESDHQRHPLRVMAGTESFPLEAFENWESVLNHSYVIGDFVWTSMDYLGEAGIGRQHYDEGRPYQLGEYPWHIAYCGDIDLAGIKRPQSYYRDILWQNGSPLSLFAHYPHPEGKTPYITRWGWPDVVAGWNWAGHEGRAIQVDVYSAAESVELFLNGRSLGTKPTTAAEKHLATFDVPYEPGELRAVGTMAGGGTVEAALHTTGAPAALRVTADHTALPAAKDSLCYVTVEVVDDQGRLIPDGNALVTFAVEGPATLFAVGSGDPTTTESYRGSQRSAFRGQCLAVVQSTGEPGAARLTATADGLRAAETSISYA